MRLFDSIFDKMTKIYEEKYEELDYSDQEVVVDSVTISWEYNCNFYLIEICSKKFIKLLKS